MEEQRGQCSKPMRYAPMPIYEGGGYDSLGEDTQVIGYIAAPCYLISESTIYLDENNKKTRYKVVFTKDNKRLLEENKEKIPQYNSEGECINSDTVEIAETDFSVVKKHCDQQNSEYMNLSILGITDSQIRAQAKRKYQKKIERYYQLIELDPKCTYLDKLELPQLDVVERINLLNDFKIALMDDKISQEILEEFYRNICPECSSQKCKGALKEEHKEGCLRLAFYAMKRVKQEKSPQYIKK